MKSVFWIFVAAIALYSCSGQQEEKTQEEKDYRVPVKIKTIQHEEFNHYIQVTGSVEALNDAFISPEMNGQIKKIYVKEGSYVSKGQTLAVLNTSVIQKNIEELKTGLELATTLFDKQKELWDQGIGSEVQYLQTKNQKESLEKKLETLNAQLNLSTIAAPFSGMVENIMQKEGELGVPGMQLMQIVNLSKLKINADVSESYLSKISKGDSVKINFPAYPDLMLKKPITRTGNVIKTGNRTFEIEVELNNFENNKLKPNIISTLFINDYSKSKALTVPSIIIKKDMKGDFLFIAEQTDSTLIAKKKYIETGMSEGDRTEILQGVSIGDKVIVEGYNLVSTGIEVVKK